MYNSETIKKLKITSIYPPTMCDFPNGKKYAIFTGLDGGWFEIDSSVTFEDIKSCWIKEEYSIINPSNLKSRKLAMKEWKHLSSKGDKHYVVQFKNDRWTCTCPAFGFRKKCKHIDLSKETLTK